MVAKLADALDLPLRARNALLLAAGFAPVFKERDLGVAEMQKAREALELILDHHEPYPAIVMNASWDIVMRNAAASRLLAACVEANHLRRLSANGRLNFMNLMFDLNGLRPSILNWGHTRATLIRRLRRDAILNPGGWSDNFLKGPERERADAAEKAEITAEALEPMLSLELRVGVNQLKLFSAFTTFGAPQDIALQELRIDMSFPADDASKAILVGAANDSEIALK
jgi:hypothetical protein